MGAGRFGPGFERLIQILTEEQQASLREAMQGQREKISLLESKMLKARKDLFEAGLSEKFDEGSVREKAMDAAKLDAELMVLRAKAFSQVRPPLSAEQLEQVKKFQNFLPGRGEIKADSQKRRPEIKRDENGLPEKPKAE